MPTADEQVIVDGQRAVAVSQVSGDFIYDGGATDPYCIVNDNGTAQRALKVAQVGGEGGGGGGGGDVPANVYTQDNLVAGKDISITLVPQPIYDENTLGVWHLDDETGANAITTGAYAQTTLFTESHVHTTSFSKFGTGSCLINTTNVLSSAALLLNINSTLASSNFTLDMWVRTPTGSNQNYKLTIIFGISPELYIYLANNRIQIGNNQTSTTAGTWHHLAMERYNNTLNGYVDGTLIYTASTSQTASFDIKVTNENQSYIPGSCLDEVRLSNVARYQGQNFTPFDVAYSANLPLKYQINNTKPDPDLSAYLKNKAVNPNYSLMISSNNYVLNANETVVINPAVLGNQNAQRAVALGVSAACNPNCVSVGYNAASTTSGVAIGMRSIANSEYSIAIGTSTSYSSLNGAYVVSSVRGIAIGTEAQVSSADGAIQLGKGTNSTANTFQVFAFQLLDGTTGLIPAERIGTGYDATKTQVLKNVNGTLTWVDEA